MNKEYNKFGEVKLNKTKFILLNLKLWISSIINLDNLLFITNLNNLKE